MEEIGGFSSKPLEVGGNPNGPLVRIPFCCCCISAWKLALPAAAAAAAAAMAEAEVVGGKPGCPAKDKRPPAIETGGMPGNPAKPGGKPGVPGGGMPGGIPGIPPPAAC